MFDYTNLNDKAYFIIKNMVLNNEFDRDTTYSETKLSANIGISRTPVRDAIHKLESEGFIDIIPSKGFKIHTPNSEEIADCYEQRCAIEGFAIYNLCKNIKNPKEQAVLEKVKEYVRLHKEAYLSDEKMTFIRECDLKIHETMVHYLENKKFNDIFEHHIFHIFMLSSPNLTSHNIYRENVIEQHYEIVEAIESGNFHRAYDAIYNHFEFSKTVSINRTIKGTKYGSHSSRFISE